MRGLGQHGLWGPHGSDNLTSAYIIHLTKSYVGLLVRSILCQHMYLVVFCWVFLFFSIQYIQSYSNLWPGKLACPRVNEDQKIDVGDWKLNSGRPHDAQIFKEGPVKKNLFIFLIS